MKTMVNASGTHTHDVHTCSRFVRVLDRECAVSPLALRLCRAMRCDAMDTIRYDAMRHARKRSCAKRCKEDTTYMFCEKRKEFKDSEKNIILKENVGYFVAAEYDTNATRCACVADGDAVRGNEEESGRFRQSASESLRLGFTQTLPACVALAQ
jgi:hypothetical protein